VEYLELWNLLMDFQLQLEVEEALFQWIILTKSTYDGFFLGFTLFKPWERF